MDNTIFLQKQVRDNSEDLRSYLKDLEQWEENMKRKESDLHDNKDFLAVPIPRNKAQKIVKDVKEVKKEKPKVKSCDYAAWEKFDVEAECEKVDTEKKDEKQDEKQEEEKEEMELKTNFEVQKRMKDEALFEKERGNQFVKNRKWSEAISCYTRSISCDPSDPIFFANRALCFLKKNDLKSVDADCTSALLLNDSYVKALQRRAVAKEGLKQYQEALDDLYKILELEPHNKETRKELDRLEKRLGIRKVEVKKPENIADPKIKTEEVKKPEKSAELETKTKEAKKPEKSAELIIKTKELKKIEKYADPEIKTIEIKKPEKSTEFEIKAKVANTPEKTAEPVIKAKEAKKPAEPETKEIKKSTELESNKITTMPIVTPATKGKPKPQPAVEDEKVILKTPEIPWPERPQSEVIIPVQKLPHHRSKKPLRKIEITETEDSNLKLNPAIEKELKIDYNDSNALANILAQTQQMDIDEILKDTPPASTKKIPDDLVDLKFDYPVPKSSVQFYTNWKIIKDNLQHKFLYLKQIRPEDLANIFKDFFESDIFSDFITVLKEKFIPENLPVFNYLLNLSKVKRFSTLTLFLSAKDKQGLKILFNYSENIENVAKNEVTSLYVKYEL